MKFTIHGPPRTKKTSQRIVRVKGRPIIVPSKTSKDWENDAILQLRSQHGRAERAVAARFYLGCPGQPCMIGVNVRALIYRDANRGDAVGYYQAIADALERSGVVENDRLCVSWDGSRLLVDRHCPRVELELTPADVQSEAA